MNESQPSSLPAGFLWSATKAGIKASGKPDLALALAPEGATAAAAFTSNQMVAAPIIIGRQHIAASDGRVTALLINAGNANCATGQHGLDACVTSCDTLAALANCRRENIFPSSTGIIGVPLPAEKITAALPTAFAALAGTEEAADSFRRAIMTTDTKPKSARATVIYKGRSASIFGVCKGAGMIGPQLGPPHATMLVYLFTDIAATPAQLREALGPAVEASFNSISIDGDTSTNDTVLLLASGASGLTLDSDTTDAFRSALNQVTQDLAHQIVDDGEGVTHVVTLHVTGAASVADARAIARTIANSPLCKTAWSSGDPNWGRIIAAAGRSGVVFDPALVSIHIGDQAVFEAGTRSPHFDEAAAHAVMLQREYTIRLDLHAGQAETRFLTCDLTHEYVSINADYSS
ncbi:bifunctional glutamate N-acetyltransferase/amino-acid acetyltransferase ArgJ [Terriglobus albidus]|uniref:Arginine biosynthesis bifunctional protein ArgJ n=1 Tax=Terriglobus albidus TaxID=1592106 RepID=A0A5B9EGR3_9BACT|nr:bifunctional glutamate N-acetyltransferase/amino-acid acetyltransferase ArgJ [Terriglobus albidus]QEE29527.1 bifunctional glutamate N-acetyltransferase/amino-acid acetyltransferase ArgJ [Terriglobus albidus]